MARYAVLVFSKGKFAKADGRKKQTVVIKDNKTGRIFDFGIGNHGAKFVKFLKKKLSKLAPKFFAGSQKSVKGKTGKLRLKKIKKIKNLKRFFIGSDQIGVDRPLDEISDVYEIKRDGDARAFMLAWAVQLFELLEKKNKYFVCDYFILAVLQDIISKKEIIYRKITLRIAVQEENIFLVEQQVISMFDSLDNFLLLSLSSESKTHNELEIAKMVLQGRFKIKKKKQ